MPKQTIADIDKKHKGNVAFALLENGHLIATHFVSVGKAGLAAKIL